jgi:hypothetical protein
MLIVVYPDAPAQAPRPKRITRTLHTTLADLIGFASVNALFYVTEKSRRPVHNIKYNLGQINKQARWWKAIGPNVHYDYWMGIRNHCKLYCLSLKIPFPICITLDGRRVE